MNDSTLPPVPAQAAIILGFLEGTWALVNGFHRIITGDFIRVWGHSGPWSAWGGAAVILGALWMIVGNLYLFQNRAATWKAMVILVVLSSWFAGWAVALVLIAQLILLLLPSTRSAISN